MAQKIKITQTSNADMNIGVHKNCHISTNNSDTKQITMIQQTISKMERVQTAVEWLFEQIGNGNITSEKTDCGYLITINNDCYEQAKQMEKEQIEKAFSAGQETPINHPTLPHYSREEYYNDTYNK